MGFLKEGPRQVAEANWDKFGTKYNKAFQNKFSEELKNAITYLCEKPPRKQIINNDKLDWSEQSKYNERDPLLTWLLCKVRRVRNNLFHGGKYQRGPINSPEHDKKLLNYSNHILSACLSLDEDLRTKFEEKL